MTSRKHGLIVRDVAEEAAEEAKEGMEANVIKERLYTFPLKFTLIAWEQFKALRDRIGDTSSIKTFHLALSLLSDVVDEIAKGNSVFIGTEEKGVREMPIPRLRHLKNKS